MASIYDEKSEELYKLLDKAAQSTGATLVIPDLQRPYVWTPNQVTLLIDSLIRGWPFGTLLLWRVQHDEKRNIPSRAFWQVVDRTGDEDGTPLMEQQPPAEYQMVLDGQQRIQSLLLATHGEGWGFRLKDRDWWAEVGTRDIKSVGKSAHWSQGCLCLDLEKFLSGYAEANEQLAAVEFEKVLVWAITDKHGGRSKGARSKTYKEPLRRRFDPENSAKLIRFSRLWQLAGFNTALKEKNYYEDLRRLLTEHGAEKATQDKAIAPLAELMTTLRDVKVHKVAFLELAAFDQAVSDKRETYDDAIVNIFTRLNTAGRTLTREEITFAWLKVGWNTENTAGQSAHECFSSLQKDLRLKGQADDQMLEIDELVAAVSFIWSVAFHRGGLLTNRDLLKGDIIRPMAGDLSRAWAQVRAAIVEVATGVNERRLERGKHYTSFNALLVLAAARFQVLQRAAAMTLKVTERDHLEKGLEELLREYTDRWLICSTWAGRWARASGQILGGYAAQLAKDSELYDEATSVEDLLDLHKDRLEALVRELETDALRYIDGGLAVDSREQVRQYFTALWLWHRLDAKRWEASKSPLRIGRTRSDSLDVDHVVSVKLWSAHAFQDLLQEDEELEQFINSIGNCLLLQKSFNIAKSDRPLEDFLANVHEFKQGKSMAEWASALSLTPEHMNGKTADTAALLQAIKDRETSIRSELIRFVKGECKRVDS